MTCPICNKRKAKRQCPARAESICSICCGTEREVTIDCPSDCVHLISSREYDRERLEVDWSKIPFPDAKFDRSFAESHGVLLVQLDYAIAEFGASHRELVDSDVLAALENLAESYRTLASGLVYEKPIHNPLQRGLSEKVKAAKADLSERMSRDLGATTLRNSDARDALIFLTQLCAIHMNGRSKGRAYLDLIRGQFPKEEFQKTGSNIVLLS